MLLELFIKKFNIHCETSEQFWSQLLVLIGTEEDVQIRRDVNDIYTYALCDNQKTCDYMSGSKGEGFLFPWRDIDIMQSLVRQTISMETFHDECMFTAKKTGCRAGFCKLLLNNNEDIRRLQDFYLSRIKYEHGCGTILTKTLILPVMDPVCQQNIQVNSTAVMRFQCIQLLVLIF